MNNASRTRFLAKAKAAAESLKPGSVIIGETPHEGAIFHGTERLEQERGGYASVKTIVFHLDKVALSDAPEIGTMMTEVATGEKYELYEVGGLDLPKWILRGATFPERS